MTASWFDKISTTGLIAPIERDHHPAPRRAVGMVNRVRGSLRLEKHPDKTFIGRIEPGFDFLGYHFTPGRLILAVGTTPSGPISGCVG